MGWTLFTVGPPWGAESIYLRLWITSAIINRAGSKPPTGHGEKLRMICLKTPKCIRGVFSWVLKRAQQPNLKPFFTHRSGCYQPWFRDLSSSQLSDQLCIRPGQCQRLGLDPRTVTYCSLCRNWATRCFKYFCVFTGAVVVSPLFHKKLN